MQALVSCSGGRTTGRRGGQCGVQRGSDLKHRETLKKHCGEKCDSYSCGCGISVQQAHGSRRRMCSELVVAVPRVRTNITSALALDNLIHDGQGKAGISKGPAKALEGHLASEWGEDLSLMQERQS